MSETSAILFISYSHDSQPHRDKILSLSERLRQDGFETRLDQYENGAPEQGWPRWMLDRLDEATHVLVICTETYYRRFRGHEKPDRGKGVDWEGALITLELYNAKSKSCKFVPILFDPDDAKFIPEPLRGWTHYTLDSADGYRALCDFLDGVAGFEPREIGRREPRERPRGTPLAFPNEAKDDEWADAEAKFQADLQLPEDEQRKLLAAKAVELLATSEDALDALASRLEIPDSRDAKKRALAAIDRLLERQNPPQVLEDLVLCQIGLDCQGLKVAADTIEQVAYYTVPAALAAAHVEQITLIANSNAGKYEFQAKTKTFVEIAIARANGRATKFRRVQDQRDNPSGLFCLAKPPEEGMDADHERFIGNFVDELGQMVGSDLLDVRDRTQNIRAINAELDAQFKFNRWQYYYVFENPLNDSERRKRHDLAKKLDSLFPRIAFIALDRREPSADEVDTLAVLQRILCRAAGIEIKPHET